VDLSPTPGGRPRQSPPIDTTGRAFASATPSHSWAARWTRLRCIRSLHHEPCATPKTANGWMITGHDFHGRHREAAIARGRVALFGQKSERAGERDPCRLPSPETGAGPLHGTKPPAYLGSAHDAVLPQLRSLPWPDLQSLPTLNPQGPHETRLDARKKAPHTSRRSATPARQPQATQMQRKLPTIGPSISASPKRKRTFNSTRNRPSSAIATAATRRPKLSHGPPHDRRGVALRHDQPLRQPSSTSSCCDMHADGGSLNNTSLATSRLLCPSSTCLHRLDRDLGTTWPRERHRRRGAQRVSGRTPRLNPKGWPRSQLLSRRRGTTSSARQHPAAAKSSQHLQIGRPVQQPDRAAQVLASLYHGRESKPRDDMMPGPGDRPIRLSQRTASSAVLGGYTPPSRRLAR